MIKLAAWKTVRKSETESANALLKQLLHDPKEFKPLKQKDLQNIVSERNTIAVVARDNDKIVGFGLLFVVHKVRGRYAYIEDMIVSDEYRGQGIGKRLAQKLIDVARYKKISTIELSSRPSRIAANNLYLKLGFKHKDTNVYRLKL